MHYDWDKACANIDYDDESQGDAKIKLTFEVRIYFDSDLERFAKDFQGFYDRAMEIANTEFNYWFTPFSARYASDGYVHVRKGNKTMRSYLSNWIEQEKWDKPFSIELHASKNDFSIGDTSVQICNEPYYPGYLRLLLPVETFEKGAQTILEMVRYLVADMDYISAYLGPGVNVFNPSYQKLSLFSDVIRKRMQRYLCVDFTDPYKFKNFEQDGLLNVAWMTLLGEKRIKQSRLSTDRFNDLPESIHVHQVGAGLCVQADAFAISGEVGYEKTENYLAVCHLLGSAKLSGSNVHPFDSLGSTQLTVDWVDRFCVVS